MGRSLGASIVYGFKIHGEDEGWPLPYNDDTYSYVWPGWARTDDDEAEEFESQCQDQLIRVFADFTDPEPEVDWTRKDYQATPEYKARDAWHAKQHEAKKRANIDCGEGSLDFHRAGITDYMDVYLGFEVYDFSWSEPRINVTKVNDDVVSGILSKGWASTLERAVEALNFTPREGFDLEPATYMLVTYR